MVTAIAVAVVLWWIGNQVAESRGAIDIPIGPGKLLSICPICMSHVAGVDWEVIHRTPHPTATIIPHTIADHRRPIQNIKSY